MAADDLLHLSFVAANSQFSTAQVSIVYVFTITVICHDFGIKQSHCVMLCYSLLCIYKTITLCYIMFIMANELSLVNSVCHFCILLCIDTQ